MSAEYERILTADVGSTTTKTVMFEREGERYRLRGQAGAPTTVEAPHEDVMVGVRRSLERLETVAGVGLLEEGVPVVPRQAGGVGADALTATSSAGGGLQMMCLGLVKGLTAESAERGALGAGAIVTDILSSDDGRTVMERLQRLRDLRPDIILLAGGTDEGAISQVAALAEYIAAADPRPRLGEDLRVPVIYAGNVKARDFVQQILEQSVDVHLVDNLRPTMEEEVLGPVRDVIHRLFLEHVMTHAPGYGGLLRLASNKVRPTPAAVGDMVRLVAQKYEANALALDIGGATTDVFSVFGGRYHRSVSANIGMSYSLGNVLAEAGLPQVMRWIPGACSETDIRNWGYNKMIRPTTLPATKEELLWEHAAAREALRLAFGHHKTVAVGLRGVKQHRTFDDVLQQEGTGKTIVESGKIDLIIGSGGPLAHAPHPAQAALIMLDSLEPYGVTRLYVDKGFMLPHLGALAEILPEEAGRILLEQCLLPLGTAICLSGQARPGVGAALLRLTYSDGRVEDIEIRAGDLMTLPIGAQEMLEVEIIPRGSYDAGAGKGKRLAARVKGGLLGLIVDGRGRPIDLPEDERRRDQTLRRWIEAMGAYPGSSPPQPATRSSSSGGETI